MSDAQDTKTEGASTKDETKLPGKNSKQSKRENGYRIWIQMSDEVGLKWWFPYITYQRNKAEACAYGITLVRREYYGNRKFTCNDDFVKYLEKPVVSSKANTTRLCALDALRSIDVRPMNDSTNKANLNDILMIPDPVLRIVQDYDIEHYGESRYRKAIEWPDKKEAFRLLLDAADHGDHGGACFEVAKAYLWNFGMVTPNFYKAIEYARKGHELKHAMCTNLLTLCHREGYGTERLKGYDELRVQSPHFHYPS